VQPSVISSFENLEKFFGEIFYKAASSERKRKLQNLENFTGVVNVPRCAPPDFLIGKYLFHRLCRGCRGRGIPQKTHLAKKPKTVRSKATSNVSLGWGLWAAIGYNCDDCDE
jgi:hypothetical protein